jgi:hypothetical protein
MKHIFFTLSLLISFIAANAFSFSDTNNIPLFRQKWHDDIRKEQIACDKLDGKEDRQLKLSGNEEYNAAVTEALFKKPNELRYWVEKNDQLLPNNNDKVRYLRYVTELLINYRNGLREKDMLPLDLVSLLNEFENALKAKVVNKAVLPFIEKSSYAVAKILTSMFAEGTVEASAAASVVYVKYIALHPDKILQTLSPYASEPYADSLITLACKRNPVKFYSYAQSKNSELGKLIYASKNDTVIQIAALSQTKNALFYFPFLDDILSKKQTLADIKKYVGDGENTMDTIGYYKLLVNTAIDYYKRVNLLKDTPIAYFGANGLLGMLRYKAKQHFVDYINELHDQSNLAIRMKAIQPLAPKDLYYMMVMCDDIIYTSSYKHSFNRMLQLMGTKPRGDSLLLSVNMDHFRKFIKMAANYNRLDTFLKTMPGNRPTIVMKQFVTGLENSNLEDAVDVADAYSSIVDKKLLKNILQTVDENTVIAEAKEDKKGKVIYGLLNTIFLSANDTGKIDLAIKIGIPPIFEMPIKSMQDEKGNITEQVFFYGDKDGKAFYPSFRNSLSGAEWKVTEKREWIEAVSTKGNITIFANKPLDNETNLDDTAQVHLCKYLFEKGITPALVVHRGHSYWLERTMSRMAGDGKIIILGSCGGFQNLNKILEINPDAHIVSTKEIGAGDINGPILSYINEVYRTGVNLNWRKMWGTLARRFSADPKKEVRDSWENYVPPYKNLGAIFLKAYTLKINEE